MDSEVGTLMDLEGIKAAFITYFIGDVSQKWMLAAMQMPATMQMQQVVWEWLECEMYALRTGVSGGCQGCADRRCKVQWWRVCAQ